jgi:hypothetical protein
LPNPAGDLGKNSEIMGDAWRSLAEVKHVKLGYIGNHWNINMFCIQNIYSRADDGHICT